MYRETKEIPITVAPPVPRWQDELAEAILRGCKHTKQCFGQPFDQMWGGRITAACALGAAQLGGWEWHRHPAWLHTEIVHLNDNCRWTRESIAAWVRTRP